MRHHALCSSYASGATVDRFLPWGEVDSGTEYYYERDHLGTVISTTNTSGTAQATLGTDGYGWTLASSLTSGANTPNFAYAGMFLHSPSGLYLTLNRAYDPYSGRWLSRDSAGEIIGGINLYGYVDQDPINETDPLGLCSNDPSSLLQCIAKNSSPGGIVGSAVAGVAAVAAGAPILPYSWFGAAVSGGGPSGGTSVISALARGFIGPGLNFSSSGEFVNPDSGVLWKTLSNIAGTARKAAIVGCLAARGSVIGGLALEGYGAYQVYEA